MAMSGRLSSKLSLISEVPLALFGGSGNYASALHIAAGKANAVEKVQAGYFNASSYRKLEVILTTSVEKLGKAGETVKVAPGYFRNHLMPKMFAVPNIEKYAYLIREQRKLQQPEEVERVVKVVPQTMEDKMKQYQAVAKRLDNARLVLRRQIRVNKESGTALYELQSPVTRDELVSEAARQLCVNIQPENLYLPEPFSTVGSFEVPLHLPKSIPLPEGKVRWTLDVKIRGK